MTAQITILHNGKKYTRTLPSGTLVNALLREEGWLAQPCGIGKCGKCLIYANSEPSSEERRMLSEEALAAGLRLACFTHATEGLSISIPPARATHVLTSFYRTPYAFQPLVQRNTVAPVAPTLAHQRSDIRRLLDASGATAHALTLQQLTKLPSFLYAHEECDVVHQCGELLAYGVSETSHAVIVDIGTTTVAALLVNLENHRIVASRGEQNKQAVFGADVISRIHHVMQWQEAGHCGKDPVQLAIRQQLDAMIRDLLADASVQFPSLIVLTGNTTMLHLVCGLPAEHISRAPFIPVTTEAMRLSPQELDIQQDCPLFLMPGISSYIGADIVASMLAASAHHPQKPFLLIDLGTNAETILHVDGRFYACSAAAGPCFEGANLSCGMAGQGGAIDSVLATDDGFRITTIEHRTPIGLCGSGVLDALALLLDAGNVDETGYLEANGTPLDSFINEDENGQDRFTLAQNVHLTQKDIREVQLAKAAVRAGIEVLLEQAEITVDDIATLYLAGGFGSSLNPASAARIGLFPPALVDRVTVLGNAASFGALRYVTEENAPVHANSLIERTHYIELSSHAAFSNHYIAQMAFESTE